MLFQDRFRCLAQAGTAAAGLDTPKSLNPQIARQSFRHWPRRNRKQHADEGQNEPPHRSSRPKSARHYPRLTRPLHFPLGNNRQISGSHGGESATSPARPPASSILLRGPLL